MWPHKKQVLYLDLLSILLPRKLTYPLKFNGWKMNISIFGPETNQNTPKNRQGRTRKGSFANYHFWGAKLVSGSGKSAEIHPTICPTISNSNMQRCYENIWKMTAREQYIGDEILSNYNGCFQKYWENSKMDGENNGKPYEQMDDLGGPSLFLETPIWIFSISYSPES